MLLARAARRRALEESRTADIARDYGAAADTRVTADTAGADGSGLFKLQPSSNSDSRGRIEGRGVDDRSIDRNDEKSSERISIDEVLRLQQSGEPVVMLDVRTDRSLETSDSQVRAAVRLPPEHVIAKANELNLPKDAWLIAYCA